jgi:hypothetical protein
MDLEAWSSVTPEQLSTHQVRGRLRLPAGTLSAQNPRGGSSLTCSDEQVANRDFGVGTARQKMALKTRDKS